MYDLDKSKADRIGDCLFDKELRSDIRLAAIKKHMPISVFVRTRLLQYIEDHPLKELPSAPPEAALVHIPEVSPDAVVYRIPINEAKVIASKTDGGWKGVLYHPEKPGSVAVWNSENHNLPMWAKTNHFIRAFNFITSRIENDGMTYFTMDNEMLITANWNGHHFAGGEVIDRKGGRREKWERSGFFSSMDSSYLSKLTNVRRLLNMLCQAFRAGDKKTDGTLP